jgi:indolepyruvate ferredoxin oxidoreductase
MERALVGQYRASLDAALERLSDDNVARAVELASLPEQIRGFGHVKHDHLERVKQRWRELDAEFAGRQGAPRSTQQAA